MDIVIDRQMDIVIDRQMDIVIDRQMDIVIDRQMGIVILDRWIDKWIIDRNIVGQKGRRNKWGTLAPQFWIKQIPLIDR